MEENYEVINITEYLSYDHFKNICFINESLETQYNKNGINSFSQYLRYDTYPLVYTKNSDKNKLKEELISKFKNVERICFAFHKPKTLSDEVFFINNLPFFSKNGNNDSVQFLQELYDSLKIKHVDFLACELLLSNEWKTFFAEFKDVTIGGSNDNTGNINFGGDWIMENTMIDVKNIYFNENIDNFASLLNTYTDDEGFSYTIYSGTELTISEFPTSNPDLELFIPSTISIGENETFPSGTYTVKVITGSSLNDRTFKKIVVPSTIEFFELSYGHTAPNTEFISVDTNNPYFYSINDKIIVRKSDELLVRCSNINGTSRIILDTVKIIGIRSFQNCSDLKYIECPNVTYIHDFAFVGCTSLNSAIFRKVEYIRSGVFAGLSNLTKLIIPEVHTMRNDCLSGISITSLYVPKFVFNISVLFPSLLTELTVNSNTQIFGVMPPNLKKITIVQSSTNNLNTIKSGTVVVYNNNVVHFMKDIFNTLKTHIITINGPTGITNHAGSNLTRSFEIHSDTVTHVDMQGATNLVNLNTPNLLTIDKRGLDLTSITKAHFPSLQSVGQYGFARNSNLKSFYISPNLSLNEQAFREGLNNLNEIIFDKNLTEINDSVINAFNSSTNHISNPITSVKVSDSKTDMSSAFILPDNMAVFPTSIVNPKDIKNKCKNIISLGNISNVDSSNFHNNGELVELINIKTSLLSITGNFVNSTGYFENKYTFEQLSENFTEKYVGILNDSDVNLNVNRYHNKIYINKLSSSFDKNVYDTTDKKKEYTKGMVKSLLKMYNKTIIMNDWNEDSLPGFTPNIDKDLYIYDGKTKQAYLRDEMISKSFYIYTEPGTSVDIETVDFYLINVTQNTETDFLINVKDSLGNTIQDTTNYYKGDAYYFNGTSFTLGSIQGESEIVVCFAEDTDILCLDNDTGNEIYVNVKNLKEGTYVKTLNSGYIPVYKTKSRDINYKNNINKTEIERTSDRIFKYEKDENMTKDLFLTGSHAILKDELTDDETIKVKQFMKNLLKQDTDMMPVTEGKFRLMCMYDKNAELINEQDTTVYHVALEHSDNNMNYGIYANGKLVESCSKYSIDEMFN